MLDIWNYSHHSAKFEFNTDLTNSKQLTSFGFQVKKIQVYREMMMASNRSIAEYNLNLEPKLAHGKEMLVEAHKNKEVIQKDFDKNKGKLGEYIIEGMTLHCSF